MKQCTEPTCRKVHDDEDEQCPVCGCWLSMPLPDVKVDTFNMRPACPRPFKHYGEKKQKINLDKS